MIPLPLAAAQATALDKLQRIPPAFWLRLGLVVLAVIVAVLLLRKLAQANKVVLAIVALIVMSAVGFNWIYERNEPAWATPVVEKLANFFPSKGSYATKQATTPKQ